MKDTLYTIPLTDAFLSHDECPFCFLHKKLEQDAIAFTLGSSYMEDDYRALTDAQGFCHTHYQKLYDYGNRLGLALILQTHYQSIISDLDKMLDNVALPTPSLLKKLTQHRHTATQLPLVQAINKRVSSCFICNRVDENMERYAKTFFHLISSNDDFKILFKDSKGFCLAHFSMLYEMAPLYLNEASKSFFIEHSKSQLLDSLKRIEGDLAWFIDKYDYRNSKEPWKNAKDAIPRSIQKLSMAYVQDEVFKE